MYQPLLPIARQGVLYICLNEACFYVDAVLAVNDCVWKHVWNSDLQDLDLLPHCPSCGELIWRERDDSQEW